MKFGIVVNINREDALELAAELVDWLKARNLRYVLDATSARKTGMGPSAAITELNKECDAFISLGGDGTLLFTSHYSVTKPVIGINVGHLGFLAEFSKTEMYDAVESVVNGSYSIHSRSQLETEVRIGGKPHYLRALNDVVIEKGTYPRIPTFIIRLDGELLSAYRADGIIIATSTGSTAYSLSAGGPVIAPKSNVFVITPICPHMLTVRPIVISDDKTIEVSVDAHGGQFPLNCDGHVTKMLNPGETITVRKSNEVINLVANADRRYCEILRNKLLWGREHHSGN
ncbi:NAD(+)/NADH kinase [Prosthecochloris sp. N3]|uniref:NAD kinase n=1 Tax=Prosthecochloris ethylica TaxID=2743976 RepID=A0ABR9XU07_9CHLB|nr:MULTISPECIES: NAD(+)/NADH kinase [Prosthecochloris]MEC9486010.1 NAD(+)/NADH kinase [Prosthecochloris sp.]MBF0587227.1 NAD(+)/NADH kinase [Prosthecochloris ethylica]MBF0637300.1 NAD(+)/NADH kinase [Prosthecochloris ethylica]NUK48389.1 NAD(+)/NADH kinase [Prosthecochloris ethylica]RNA65606.1 NAD(+)/NADH kinase [Prosthecochloris sp. ZM_2]